MIEGASELMAVGGIGVVCILGSAILKESGKAGLATVLDVAAYLSAFFVVIELVDQAIDKVESVFRVKF